MRPVTIGPQVEDGMDIVAQLSGIEETGDDVHLSRMTQAKLRRNGLYERVPESGGGGSRCSLTEKGRRVMAGETWLLPGRRRLFLLAGSASVMFGVDVFGDHADTWWHRAFVMPAYRIASRLSSLKWAFMHRWVPRHQYNVIRTGLRPGYYDIDKLMLHGCFALLRRYVESERGGEAALEKRIRALRATPDPNAPEGLVEANVSTDETALEAAMLRLRQAMATLAV